MTSDVKLMVAACKECLGLRPSQQMEPQIQIMASRSFEAVSVDLGNQHGAYYLVLIDRYSGWPMVKPLKKLNTAEVTSILEDWFWSMENQWI